MGGVGLPGIDADGTTGLYITAFSSAAGACSLPSYTSSKLGLFSFFDPLEILNLLPQVCTFVQVR